MSRGAPLDEIGRIYKLRLRDFLRTAAAISGSPEAARDAVHDAFLSAIKGRRRYRGDGSIEAWLWRAVVTSALKRRRDAREVLTAEPLGVGTTANGASDTASFHAALALLPQRQRLVVFLRYYADLDYASIADVLQISPGTVGAALHAAHRSLRRQLEEVSSHE
jgi:RNA polymerase sigma-70 factor, ECF subfamily